jgi:ribosome maturation factor RimP
MTNPLIKSIKTLAEPIAEQLNLKIVNIIFQTNKNPANLRIDIKNLLGETSLENCEKMSRLLEESLDKENIIPLAYTLEISSPGISNQLTTDREFISFRGFPVIVETNTVFKKRTKWQGKLQGRDEESVYVNCKGKIVKIPRNIISQVELESF